MEDGLRFRVTSFFGRDVTAKTSLLRSRVTLEMQTEFADGFVDAPKRFQVSGLLLISSLCGHPTSVQCLLVLQNIREHFNVRLVAFLCCQFCWFKSRDPLQFVFKDNLIRRPAKIFCGFWHPGLMKLSRKQDDILCPGRSAIIQIHSVRQKQLREVLYDLQGL